MATILNSAILNSATAILHSNTLLSFLRFTQKHSPSTLNLTQTHSFSPNLDDGSHLEFCHHGFCHFAQRKTSLIHSDSTSCLQLSWNLPSLIWPFCTKKLSLIHSYSTWWLQLSWTMPSWIQLFYTKNNFTHSFWLNLMMVAILNSAMLDSDSDILDSDTLSSSLRFTQEHSSSALTLTQTNSIWLT